jgi:hypothetical protein
MRRINRTLDNGSGSCASSCSCTDNFSASWTCSKELRAGVGVPDDKGSSRSIGLSKVTSVVDDMVLRGESQVVGKRHWGWMERAYLSIKDENGFQIRYGGESACFSGMFLSTAISRGSSLRQSHIRTQQISPRRRSGILTRSKSADETLCVEFLCANRIL